MLLPLLGHDDLQARLLRRIEAGTLPQSLLLHGEPGVGKQRLGLWIAQALLCAEETRPCGSCRDCRYVLDLTHPDLTWVFPRPRPKDSDSDPEDIAEDLAEQAARRAANGGLYAPPAGTEGIYVATVRHLVARAARTPALARRKVFVIGEVDRMAQQEGAEVAANAFLKLLEEPPADTDIVITTSAVGSLLPTIRSRVVAMRVKRVDDAAVRAFIERAEVAEALADLDLPRAVDQQVALAHGAPGALLASRVRQSAIDDAARFLAAATSGNRAELLKLAFVQGHSGARGGFSDVLDALTIALHQRMREQTGGPDPHGAGRTSRAIDFVEDAKKLADGNVSPQLITARLLTDLVRTL